MAVRLEMFWGNNYYRNPPLTEAAIRTAESRLGVKLPREYLELLRRQNGGYTTGLAFPMTQPTSWASDHVPLPALAGIVVDPDHQGVHNIMKTDYMTREWDLPPRQVLLCGDGHWWLTLDYRRSDDPAVSWIDVEVGEDVVVAPSFASFLHGLVSEAEFNADPESHGRWERWQRRLLQGCFGAFLFALIGMITSASFHASLPLGTLIGAVTGFLIGFLLGLDAIEALMHGWPTGK